MPFSTSQCFNWGYDAGTVFACVAGCLCCCLPMLVLLTCVAGCLCRCLLVLLFALDLLKSHRRCFLCGCVHGCSWVYVCVQVFPTICLAVVSICTSLVQLVHARWFEAYTTTTRAPVRLNGGVQCDISTVGAPPHSTSDTCDAAVTVLAPGQTCGSAEPGSSVPSGRQLSARSLSFQPLGIE